MIDLHCHLLPGIDDGATDLEVSIAMARAAVADGITMTACTPHIMPGVYNNNRTIIEERMAILAARLADEGIDLKLAIGADVHMDVELVSGLKSGRIPSLNDSRYFLFEPPHHVPPPRLEDNIFSIMSAGYVPILTHPERLSWIETHYAMMERLVRMGVIVQITAGSVTGRFGRRVQRWADKMLDEGLVHVVSTDAHNLTGRPPNLSEARDEIAERLGEAESVHMTLTRPQVIIDNLPPERMPALHAVQHAARSGAPKSFLARLGLGWHSRTS
ncbi:protein-tyrosine phosphatase [Kaistia soli DSM 19436]|uniref:protein-tyrosine-phosphatase n=1 Tax=Kaistia soli DSM 19436 TaxID=1122133 RepID=A0A1M5PLL3_9HYPH|nr:CpsB/CapC family capsule biosynthesis tyrosine phosphatase [Kaistia soli]SHH02668.1 protein-tyrosine phosphatase [Kaistia soli DSM 19436]